MTAATELPQILVIDDEMGPRESLRMLLKPNYQVHTADCVEAGIKLLKEKQPDTIVMDIRMPGVSGIEGLRQIREIDPNLSDSAPTIISANRLMLMKCNRSSIAMSNARAPTGQANMPPPKSKN